MKTLRNGSGTMGTIAGLLIPVFGVIVLGFIARRTELLPAASVEVLNRFAYYLALPALLFTLTARAPLGEFFNWPFIWSFLGGTVVTLALALAVGRLLFRRHGADLSLHALAAVFGNTAYMGIPLFVTAFGPKGALPAVIATVVSNILIFGGAVVVVEFHKTESAPVWRLVRSLTLNPLLVACYLGLVFSALAVTLPRPLEGLLNLMAQPAAPVALFALGLSLAAKPFREAKVEVGWLVALKLAVQPAITWVLAARWLGHDPMWMKSAVLMAAMPTGALVFVLSQFHWIQVGRASSAIVVSTVLAVVSLSVFVLLLGGVGGG